MKKRESKKDENVYFLIHRRKSEPELVVTSYDWLFDAERKYNLLRPYILAAILEFNITRSLFSVIQKKHIRQEEVGSLVAFGKVLVRDVIKLRRTKEIYYVFVFKGSKLELWKFDNYNDAYLKYKAGSLRFGWLVLRVLDGKTVELVESYGTDIIKSKISSSMRFFGEEVLEKLRETNVLDIYRTIMKPEFEEKMTGDYNWDDKRLRITKKSIFYCGVEYKYDKVSETVIYVEMSNGMEFVMILNVEDSILQIMKVKSKPDHIFRRKDSMPIPTHSFDVRMREFFEMERNRSKKEKEEKMKRRKEKKISIC